MNIYGADLEGIEGRLISFRAVREPEKQGATLLGLPHRIVREALERALHAITTLEGNWNVTDGMGYTIDLNPAECPKISSGLALPLAVVLLCASILQREDEININIDELKAKLDSIDGMSKKETIKRDILTKLQYLNEQRERVLKYSKRLSDNHENYLFIGNFNISTGDIECPLYGTLGMISAAKDGFTVIVPEEAEIHAALVLQKKTKTKFIIAKNIQEVWNVILGLSNGRKVKFKKDHVRQKKINDYVPDLKTIEGVAKAKFAMAIAVAGGHNILLVGAPGQGKSMLSKASIRLLPKLKSEEIYEINKIYSAKGELRENELITSRPYCEANNNITEAGLFGGGVNPIVPGLISLAHRGILFFDEINQCDASLIENLRVPLSDNKYSISRSRSIIEYPCKFMFISAMNPCRCGWLGHSVCNFCGKSFYGKTCPTHGDIGIFSKCICSPSIIKQYKNKLSKPLLDRIDIKVFVSSLDTDYDFKFDYVTETVKSKIQKARDMQEQRYSYSKYNIFCNGDVQDKSQMADIDDEIHQHIKKITKKYNIETKRTEVKLLLVSRTIADFYDEIRINAEHVERALDIMGFNDPYFQEM